jgi:hypothetical protein
VNERASPAGARRPRARRWYIAIVRSFAAASPAGDDAASRPDNAPAITPVLGAKCMLVVSRVDLAA